MKGFLMTVAVAERFFRICHRVNATTLEHRSHIMNKLLHKANIQIVKEQQIKEIMKDKKVLRVKPND